MKMHLRPMYLLPPSNAQPSLQGVLASSTSTSLPLGTSFGTRKRFAVNRGTEQFRTVNLGLHSLDVVCNRALGGNYLATRRKEGIRKFDHTIQARSSEDEDSDAGVAKTKDASVEKGILANEELLLFFYQLDLTTRLQKALNMDQYEPAKQIREKIAEVERELARQRELRMGPSSKDEAHGTGLAILRAKTELQRAIEEERYSEAAALRDSLSSLEADVLAASLSGLASSQAAYAFRLGQRVRHSVFGYYGVVCGVDPQCCESEDWVRAAGVDAFERGRRQPFYQVLVDMQEVAGFLVAYVAEERMQALEDAAEAAFSHPYTYLLFYGTDGKGDFIPTKQLREKYNAARHELPYEEDPDGGTGDPLL